MKGIEVAQESFCTRGQALFISFLQKLAGWPHFFDEAID